MRKTFFLALLSCTFLMQANAQKPKNGKYKFTVSFAEAQGASMGKSCVVIVKGDSVFVINDGTLTGEKGRIMESGILRQHKKTGKWMVSNSTDDVNLPIGKIGGCEDGPTVVDFKKKKWLTC